MQLCCVQNQNLGLLYRWHSQQIETLSDGSPAPAAEDGFLLMSLPLIAGVFFLYLQPAGGKGFDAGLTITLFKAAFSSKLSSSITHQFLQLYTSI